MSGTVRIERDMLVFELHGADELVTLKRRIEMRLAHVVSVSTERDPIEPNQGLGKWGLAFHASSRTGSTRTMPASSTSSTTQISASQ